MANRSQDAGVGWSFLRSKRWLGYFTLLLVFSIVSALLGNWQFARRAEARAEIARVDANYDAAPVPVNEVVAPGVSFDENQMKWRPVLLQGRYVGEPVLARNRPGLGAVGSNIIHPFLTETGDVMFIDRGWTDVSAKEASDAVLPQPPDGLVTVIARLRESEPSISGRSSAGNTVASINGEELASLTGTTDSAITSAYGQLISEEPSAETGVLAQRPVRDEGPHLSYALQWYVFILIALIGFGYAARLEYRNLNAASEAVQNADSRRAARSARRKPSDADEEDALLNQV